MNDSANPHPVMIFVEEDDSSGDDEGEVDDDDIPALSPLPYQWNLQATVIVPSHPLHVPVLDDDDLQLRLGPSVNSSRLAGRHTRPVSSPLVSVSCLPNSYFFPTIDLTVTNDKFEANYRVSQKTKRFISPLERPRELKLTCAICMETMEEETSTVCGHIFCWNCISQALKTQKKCPTCRRRLTNSQIHRIYLP